MTFGWQKLGLQSWQSGMQPTVFWQTHNWPSDHQPTFCTQVTEGTWAFNRSLLLILFISANISPESNTEKTYTHPHISSHLLKRTWYMQQKLLKTSFKSSWQPKVNKRKAHLWWTLIQKEGTNILHCFNTRLCIKLHFSSMAWNLSEKGSNGKIGIGVLIDFRRISLRTGFIFRWKKRKARLAMSRLLLLGLPRPLWEKETHISGDK